MTVNGLFKSTIHCLHEPGSRKPLKTVENVCILDKNKASIPNDMSRLPWESI